MNVIRKISVGLNYPDKVLHYQVGKTVNLGGELHEITLIQEVVVNNSIAYNVFICGHNSSNVLWKTIINLPVVVEYLVDFE